MNTKRLERCTQNYWKVSKACRLPGWMDKVTTKQALDYMGEGDMLPPENWRLKEHMHILKFDIIEGSTQWRRTRAKTLKQLQKAKVYTLTPFTPPSISTASL